MIRKIDAGYATSRFVNLKTNRPNKSVKNKLSNGLLSINPLSLINLDSI